MGKGKKKNHQKGGRGKSQNHDATCTNVADKQSRRKKKKSHPSEYFNAAEDALLRQSVEGDGSRTILDMEPDGNCLFRSISDQLFFDHGQRHEDVRHDICDYLQGHESFFSMFLDLDDEATKGEDAADFAEYVATMREDGEWGGNLELVAAARMYRRRIRVFSSNLAAMNIDYDSDKPSHGPELLLSYHDNDHYNSVRDNTWANKPPLPKKTFVLSKDFDHRETDTDNGTKDEERTVPVSETDSSNPSSELNSELSGDSGRVEECTATEIAGENVKKAAPKKAVKANGPCPCGSNLKYKKCCKGRDRRQAVQRREKNTGNVEDDNAETEKAIQPTMEGKFRVLTI